MRQRSASRLPRASRQRSPQLAAATAACVALIAGCASPDDVERFRTKHGEFAARATALPLVSLIGTSLPEGRIHKEPGDLSFTQGLLDATVLLPQDDDGFLVVGVLAGVRDVDFEDVPVLADEQLHRYGVRIGYGRFVDDDLLVQGYWQPSVYSDLDGALNSDDYRLYYGTLLAVYRASPAWFWKVGLNGNDAVDTCVIPLGGFAWHFAERWSVQVLVPRDANLVFADGPWRAWTGFMLESDEYHIRSPDSLGLEHDVHVQELYAHLTVERSVTENIGFLIRGGSTIGGDWDWSYGDGSAALTGELETDMFVAAGITYRFLRRP